jgi:formylglycine-generating enzyme required for sulfatase activity
MRLCDGSKVCGIVVLSWMFAACSIDRVDIRLDPDAGGGDVATADRPSFDAPSPTDVSATPDRLADGAKDAPGDVTLDAVRDAAPDLSPDAPDAPDVPAASRSCALPAPPGCGRVRLPGGATTLGDAEASDPGASGGRALPVQRAIRVGAFELDLHEVTVARFRRFVMATARSAGFDARDASHEHCNWTLAAADREGHPMNCVDWETAAAFCAWDDLRGRLPTEAEWELAARGAGARPWPWGAATVSSTTACFDRCAGRCEGTCSIEGAAFAAGRTPDGLWHLAGNVQEWVADWYLPYDDAACWGDRSQTDPRCETASGERTTRGGSWRTAEAAALRGAARLERSDDERSDATGFRCAVPAR